MFTRAFWTAAAERAVKTFGQFAGIAWAQDQIGVDVFAADWGSVLGLGLGGAVASLLTSLASIPLSAGNSPSLVPDAEIEAAVR